jgi:hypothetical protein
MKTAQLNGVLLDYWVARAEGIEHPPYLREMSPGCCLIQVTEPDDGGTVTRWVAYEPSTDWSIGGPIIERECIVVDCNKRKREDPANDPRPWMSAIDGKWYSDAPTPLVAAMRCYVASKFGDEVADIPMGVQ